MFSYYGSKSKIIDYYPPPKYSKIIEPFAGSARYSLKYFDRDVLLVDKYEVIIKIWQWLQKCSEADILGLPILQKGQDIRLLNVSEEERMFLGMISGIASISPRNKVSAYSAEQNGRKNRLKNIANQLYKIRHWIIQQGCFKNIPNQNATWFIDPPYQNGGHAYIHSDIDFDYIASWSKERTGQVIVCETATATWLPFSSLTSYKAANGKRSMEAIWTNLPNSFDVTQHTLF